MVSDGTSDISMQEKLWVRERVEITEVRQNIIILIYMKYLTKISVRDFS